MTSYVRHLEQSELLLKLGGARDARHDARLWEYAEAVQKAELLSGFIC